MDERETEGGMKSAPLEIGMTYRVAYPFVRCVAEIPEFDGEHCTVARLSGWRPGCEADQEDTLYGSTVLAADAHGEMLLTVVGIYKPGKYPERVFFVREWKDPDGKVFGKPKLRVTTTAAFRGLLKGYRHDYYCNGEEIARRAA